MNMSKNPERFSSVCLHLCCIRQMQTFGKPFLKILWFRFEPLPRTYFLFWLRNSTIAHQALQSSTIPQSAITYILQNFGQTRVGKTRVVFSGCPNAPEVSVIYYMPLGDPCKGKSPQMQKRGFKFSLQLLNFSNPRAFGETTKLGGMISQNTHIIDRSFHNTWIFFLSFPVYYSGKMTCT